MNRPSRFAMTVGLCALVTTGQQVAAVPSVLLDSNLGSATFFDGLASATDLVNTGQPTLINATTTTLPIGFGFPGVNNGVAATDVAHSAFYRTVDTPASITFNLNTAINTNGYAIQSINTLAGWAGVNITQANQKYEVLVSSVGDPTFRSLGTFTNAPFSASGGTGTSTRINITDTTGVLADNVDRVRFNLTYPGFVGNNSNPGTVYRELDVTGVTASAAPAQRINLIQNGSFETPVLGAGGNQAFTTGSSSVTNWAINGEVTVVRGTFNTVASDGAQWLSLESNLSSFPNNDATISQTIATIAGREYDLIFDYTALGNGGVTTPWSLAYDVGNGPVNLLIGNPANLVIGAWSNETHRFLATGSSTTISFTGLSKVNGFYGAAIDNVGVFVVPIPEPATVSLGLLSLAGLMIRRRRVV